MTHKFLYDSQARLVRPAPGRPQSVDVPPPRSISTTSRWLVFAFAVACCLAGFSLARAVAIQQTAPMQSSAR